MPAFIAYLIIDNYKTIHKVADKQEIGPRIRELRIGCHFSQSFVAEKLFISQAAFSLIENSQNGTTSDHIIRLSKLFNVTAD